ncbi:MAG: hypothetical protein Q7J06_01830, partial [Bacteroidales bacterium]|nr:hypothetical protein [Bacteroidales bacterium]
LQWHFRTYGKVNPPEPVLRDFHNIEHRDALITYDAVQLITDEAGKPLTRWDGLTYKVSPITGENIPDESAQVEQYRYLNPRKADWPQADYIVGNPPFIGASTMRRALGDGYVDAVRSTWPEVPESADFVMHWWHIASETVRAGDTQRFGFITTNSIKQTFNRRVMQAQLEAKKPLSLAFAIPDHPWVDASDGAQVRIAMTVGAAGEQDGRLLKVRDEISGNQDEIEVKLQEQQGRLFADLKTGANVAAAKPLQACLNISSPGVKLHGAGFIVTEEQAEQLGFGVVDGLETHIRAYRNGRDLAQSPRSVRVIDLFGLSAGDVRDRFPAVYQWVLEKVKPERDAKGGTKDGAGYAALWWIFGKPRQVLRKQLDGLLRYIATVETTKHRVVQFLDATILPDNMLINIASDDAAIHGVLSSRVHIVWSLAAGGTLEDRPRYNKSLCFETFPFPETTPEQQAQIRELTERLDAHRKRQQAQHPDLTITGMYNVLEKLRGGEVLNAKEQLINSQGLVSMLRELHDDLDRAVFAAYGWDDLAAQLIGLPGATTPLPDKSEAQAEAEEELLLRLVALNSQRAAEEAKGQIRWLRPEYQNPSATKAPEQSEAELDVGDEVVLEPAAKIKKITWPKGMREQIAAVRNTLGNQAMTLESLVAHFAAPKTTAPLIIEALAALEELGMVYQEKDCYRMAG